MIKTRDKKRYFNEFKQKFESYKKTGAFIGFEGVKAPAHVSPYRAKKIIGIHFRDSNVWFNELIKKHIASEEQKNKYKTIRIDFDGFIRDYFLILTKQFEDVKS